MSSTIAALFRTNGSRPHRAGASEKTTAPARGPAGGRLPWGIRYVLVVVLAFSRLLWFQFYERQTMRVLIHVQTRVARQERRRSRRHRPQSGRNSPGYSPARRRTPTAWRNAIPAQVQSTRRIGLGEFRGPGGRDAALKSGAPPRPNESGAAGAPVFTPASPAKRAKLPRLICRLAHRGRGTPEVAPDPTPGTPRKRPG